MATQTVNYGLIKPAKTDNIDIEDLNNNFDIIDAELKKMQSGNSSTESNAAGAVFFDLNITAWTSVDFSKKQGEEFYLTEHVNGNELMAQIDAGHVPRVTFKGSDNTQHVVILGAIHAQEGEAAPHLICSEIQSSNYYGVYANYTLNIIADEGEYTIWFAVTPLQAAEEPATIKLDYSNWASGSFTEHLDDGTAITHAVIRDSTGRISRIGGIEVVGVN